MIEGIMKSIGGFLGIDADQGSIRDRIMSHIGPAAPAPTKVPETAPAEQEPFRQPTIPDVISVSRPDVLDDIGIHEEDINEILPEFEPVDVRPDDVIEKEKQTKADSIDTAIRNISENRLGLTRNKGQARNLYLDMVKKHENPTKKGLTTVNGEKRFMMIESPAEKHEPGMSKYEIGYGIKIKEDWLSDDHNKWLKINGIPVNVKEGLTQQQVDDFLIAKIGKDRAVTRTQFKNWGDMTEEEKISWQDMTYNGGIGLLKMNSEAKTAANKGYTMEGLAKLTHFTRAGKNRYRGLLKRRINMYNQAALSVAGAPVIEKYSYGPKGMRIKFSSKLLGNKFSEKFKDQVNGNDGWYDVPGSVTEGTDKLYSMNEDYQFES